MTAVHGEPRPANTGQGWTVDDSTFGARLALVRQRMQWNIKQAASECGIPPATWQLWERGSEPRRYREMCRLIADRVGCDYLWLLDGPRPADQAGGRPIPRWIDMTEQSPIQIDRPRDNRPAGRPVSGAGVGVSRTAYVDRAKRRRRDR